MPANIIIPANAGQYPSNLLVAAPYDWDAPSDGSKTQRISGSINWGGGEVMAGATVINFQGTISGFDKIRGMYVDNTQSAADVTFFFPDTSFEFTVNGGEKDYFQVVTNARQVVAISTLAIASDKTFFQLFNFCPWPLSSNKSVLTSVESAAGTSLTANGTTALIPAGINGTLRGLSVVVTGVKGGAADATAAITISDGNNNVIWGGGMSAASGVTMPAISLVQLSGLNIRFINGVNITVLNSGTAFVSGGVSTNLYTGTP